MVKNLIEDTNTFDIKTTPGYQKSLELARTRFPLLNEEQLHQLVESILMRGRLEDVQYIDPKDLADKTALIQRNAMSGTNMSVSAHYFQAIAQRKASLYLYGVLIVTFLSLPIGQSFIANCRSAYSGTKHPQGCC